MECISAESFLKQSDKVRKVLLEWWQPQIGEKIYSTGISSGECIYLGDYKDSGYEVLRLESKEKAVTDKKVFVPLLTEDQLRRFIEEKIGGKIDCMYLNHDSDGCRGYYITVCTPKLKIIKEFKDLGYDLLQAYWRVACKIAEEKQGL